MSKNALDLLEEAITAEARGMYFLAACKSRRAAEILQEQADQLQREANKDAESLTNRTGVKMNTYAVSANGTVFGTYEADSEQQARDLCAQDAGYQSEADMVRRLEQPSELVAVEKGQAATLPLYEVYEYDLPSFLRRQAE